MKKNLMLCPLVVVLLCGFADGSWLRHIPPKDRDRPNPLAANGDSIAAGHKLFEEHCAACHGDNGQGHGKKPCLHSQRVHDARPGELAWLLGNGELGKGMPSWSRLPEGERWQLVAYLQSLDVTCTPQGQVIVQ